MKKIIKGQVYDTSKAQLIAAVQLREIYQALYLKRSNEFFVHSEQGESECITPLTYLEADEWAQRFLSKSSYDRFFGGIPENDERTTASISLRKDTYQKLQRLSAACSMPASECIEKMIIGAYDELRGKTDEKANIYPGD